MNKAQIELGALNQLLRKAGVVLVVQSDDGNGTVETPTVLRIESASLHPLDGSTSDQVEATDRPEAFPRGELLNRIGVEYVVRDVQKSIHPNARVEEVYVPQRAGQRWYVVVSHTGAEVDPVGPLETVAQVLLDVEWKGVDDFVGDGGYDCCPSCRGVAPSCETRFDARDAVEKGRTVLGHTADCALEAALRKAGVR